MTDDPNEGTFEKPTTRELKLPVPEGYDRLAQVLFKALDQAANGKGKERHSSGEPFEDQPICVIARWVGVGGPLQQVVKKIQESVRLLEIKGPSYAITELLGAINYIAAAVIILEEKTVEKAIKDFTPGQMVGIARERKGKLFYGLCTTMLDEKGYCPQHGYNTTIATAPHCTCNPEIYSTIDGLCLGCGKFRVGTI